MTTRSVSAFVLLSLIVNLPVSAESAKGETEKAEKVSTQSQSDVGANKTKPSYEPDSIAHLNHEAINAHRDHKDEAAREMMSKVIAGLEQEKVSELSLAEAWGNMSLILKQQAKTSESNEALNKAQAIRTRYHMPPVEPNLVDILPNLHFRKQATEMVKETADILDGKDPLFPTEKLAKITPEAWSAAMESAKKFKNSGNTKQELVELRRALAIANALPRPNDKIVGSMNTLADLYRSMGRPYSARMFFLECVAVYEKLGKGDTAEHATLLDHAGQALIALREYAEAEKLLERAIAIYKKTLGAENADLAMAMCTLGELYIQQKEEAKGEKMLQDSRTMMKKVLKPDDMRILVSEDYLAKYYAGHGKLKEAEELQTLVLNQMENKYGKTNPALIVAINNLAQTLFREQKYAEADPLFKRSIELTEQAYGPKHSRTRHARGLYAAFLEKTGHKDEAEKQLKESTAP